MIISVTGHRPQALGGFVIPNPTFNYICKEIEKTLLLEKPDKVISGMALGVDQYFAQIAYKLRIPFIAAVPFIGQESIWPDSSQKLYKDILSWADEIVIVSDGVYSANKMQIRNEWMVDRADKVLAVFNGNKGGTYNCVEYAKKMNKEIIVIDPNKAKRNN